MISEIVNRSLRAQLEARLRQECFMQTCSRDACGGCELRERKRIYADDNSLTGWLRIQLSREKWRELNERLP